MADQITETRQTQEPGFKNSDWITTRRLRRGPETLLLGHNEEYLDVLPKFQGKDLIKLLEEKTKGGKAKFLDIGGGAGLADLDIRQLHPADKLDITVIGHREDIETPLWDGQRKVLRIEPTKRELTEKQIDFKFLDFTKLSKEEIEKLGQFDLVIAVQSLGSMDTSKYELLKKVWGLLKKDGVGLIGPLFMDLHLPGQTHTEPLSQYLSRQYGLKFERNNNGVAFQKSQEDLPDVFSVSNTTTNSETVELKT